MTKYLSVFLLLVSLSLPGIQGSVDVNNPDDGDVTSSNSNKGGLGFLEAMALSALKEQFKNGLLTIESEMHSTTTATRTDDGERSLQDANAEFMTAREFDEAFNRVYDYEEKSNPGLLNNLIAHFLPVVNNLFQRTVPDPFALPFAGSWQIPEVDFLGYCNARAGFDFNFGTLRGLSGLQIERMQVTPGTESVRTGWKGGCLETIFNALFEISISSTQTFEVSDMMGRTVGGVCSYEVDEDISGGIRTFEPKMYGALNISGILSGTKAKIRFADRGVAFRMGYSTIQGYVNEVAPPVNEAIANITAELSILAKDRVLNSVMKQQLMAAIEPTVSSVARSEMQQSEIELTTSDALKLNAGFMSNVVLEGARNFRNRVRGIFSWSRIPSDEESA